MPDQNPIPPQASTPTAPALPVNAHSAARAARLIGMLRPLSALPVHAGASSRAPLDEPFDQRQR